MEREDARSRCTHVAGAGAAFDPRSSGVARLAPGGPSKAEPGAGAGPAARAARRLDLRTALFGNAAQMQRVDGLS
jgi:hypothetical protein